MNTTSLEISKRLYELSGWMGTYCCWDKTPDKDDWHVRQLVTINPPETNGKYPAYDLGYILRKLPHHLYIEDGTKYTFEYSVGAERTHDIGGQYQLELEKWEDNDYALRYMCHSNGIGTYPKSATHADTPEDAVGLLAIKLFEEGVLK